MFKAKLDHTLSPPTGAAPQGATMTRRAAIGTAAMLASPALATLQAALASPAVVGADPILAAIEAHAAAAKAVSAFVDEHARLEVELPLARRTWNWGVWDQEPPANCQDEPRWIANELAHGRAFEAMDDAATAMATVIPQTLAGAAALLSYVADRCSESGECWQFPETLADDAGTEQPFAYFVMKSAALAIGGAA